MANLIFPLVLAILTSVTLAINDPQCTYSYGQRLSDPSIQHIVQKNIIPKGSARLTITLPKIGPESTLAFVCINIPGYSTDNTDILFSEINDKHLKVVVTLEKEAKQNVTVDVQIGIGNKTQLA